MKCDNCGCELSENQAIPVARRLTTGAGTVQVLLCPECHSPGRMAFVWTVTLTGLALLSVALIVLLGYLIS